MKGKSEFFYKILKNSHQLIIPIYQRNYDWTESQCKQLFDDLIQLHNQLKYNDSYHFFGSIVYQEKNNEDDIFSLIDGQQRVVTISLLLKAIIEVFANESDYEDEKQKQFIQEELLNNKYIEENRKIRLKPCGKNDCIVYDSIIDGNYSIYEKTGSRLIQNYNYFKERISNSNLSLGELLNAIKKLKIIEITLDKEDDAQLIFESLNSTGLKLKESDKIRNKILMNLDTSVQERYYTEYWNQIEDSCKKLDFEQFIRDYFTILLVDIPKKDELYNTFKNIYKDLSKYKFNNLEEFLKNMLKYAEICRDIYEANIGDKQTNKILKRLYSLKQNVITPYIMQLIYYKNEGNLEEKDLREILIYIETFIFRRNICNIATHGLNKIFAFLHNNIIKQKEKYNSCYMDIFKYELINHDLPNDLMFKDNFIEKDFYKIREIKPYIFTQLENKLRESSIEKDFLEQENFDIRSIEHIMPQTPPESWKNDLGSNYDNIFKIYLNRISNLTITNYNPTLSNKEFSLKLKDDNADYDYSRSGYELTKKTIVDKIKNEWDDTPQEKRGNYFEKFLKERGNFLADIACERWKMFDTKYAPKPKTKEEKEISLSDDYFDFTNVKIKSFKFVGGETINVESMADMLVKVVKILYKKNTDIICSEIKDNSKKSFIINKDQNMKLDSSFKPIDKGYIYINTHSDNKTKINQLRDLFNKYELKYGSDEISQDDLIFTIIDEQ